MTVSRQKLVEQAIRFRSPERVPLIFWNRDQEQGDIMLYQLALGAPGDGTPNAWNWTENEWGYRLISRSMASWACLRRIIALALTPSGNSVEQPCITTETPNNIR